MTSDEVFAAECLFGLMYRAAAEADGKVDDKEFAVFEELLDGRAADSQMLPPRAHVELGSVSDLARQVLNADKRRFDAHLASGGDYKAAADIEIHLQAFVDRATGPEDWQQRVANARGLIFEALFFGIRTALASGGRFGSKVSREESAQLIQLSINLKELLSETSLGLTHDDMTTVLKYTVLDKAAW